MGLLSAIAGLFKPKTEEPECCVNGQCTCREKTETTSEITDATTLKVETPVEELTSPPAEVKKEQVVETKETPAIQLSFPIDDELASQLDDEVPPTVTKITSASTIQAKPNRNRKKKSRSKRRK